MPNKPVDVLEPVDPMDAFVAQVSAAVEALVGPGVRVMEARQVSNAKANSINEAEMRLAPSSYSVRQKGGMFQLCIPSAVITIPVIQQVEAIISKTEAATGLKLDGAFKKSGDNYVIRGYLESVSAMEKHSADGPVSIDVFADILAADVQRFKANWHKNAKTEPEHWPLEMNEGDWYDQFLIFMSSGEPPEPETVPAAKKKPAAPAP